jgi:hypothetical protein
LQFRFKFNFQLFFTEPQRMAKMVPQRRFDEVAPQDAAPASEEQRCRYEPVTPERNDWLWLEAQAPS